MAREQETLARHPDLIDLLVAAGRDPITDHAASRDSRSSPRSPAVAVRVPASFARAPDELRQLAMPTLVIWGEHEPLGSIPVAQGSPT